LVYSFIEQATEATDFELDVKGARELD